MGWHRLIQVVNEVRRLAVPILLAAGAVVFLDLYGIQNQWALRLHKFAQVGFYVVLAHMIRSELWPYIDLKTLIEERHPSASGIAVMIGIVMAAIVLGGTLGL